MDFHALARKELQALCKKNKIPANITNVAMANALQSLQHVEGLEELLNSTEVDGQHSPEKTANDLLDVPRTAARTSTRRTAKEPPSSLPVTQTRRTTRRTAKQESGQENKSENVSDTPAIPTTRRRAQAGSAIRKMDTHLLDAEDNVGCEKSVMAETPVISTRGRKAPAASARSKTENKKVESTVQKVYSTRRSVKQLEETMGQLTLGVKEQTEPVKMEAEDEAIKDADLTSKNSDKEGSDDSASDGMTQAIINDKTTVGKDIESSNEHEKMNGMPQVENQTQISAPEQSMDSKSSVEELKDDVKVNEEASDDSAIIDDSKTVENGTENEPEKTNEMLQVENQTQMSVPEQDMDFENLADVATTEYVPETVNFEDLKKTETKEETTAEGFDFPEVQNVGKVYQIEDQSIKMEDLVDAEVIKVTDFAENSISLDKPLNSVKTAENPESMTQDSAEFENLIDVNVIPEGEYFIPKDPTLIKQMTPHSPLASSEQTSASLSYRKSAIKDQMPIQKMPLIVSDNKENIQFITTTNNETHKAKKENLDGKMLEELSIRQLTKLLKEKLQITNNESNDTKEIAGKPRQALQAVPGNLMTGNK